MKNSVITSMKTFRLVKSQNCNGLKSGFDLFNSSLHPFSSKGRSLIILAMMLFGIFSTVQAQQLVSMNAPITTKLNFMDRFDFAQTLIADSYTITGTVLDEENLPLGGVNVFLKGTKEGTTTDFDGRFEFPRTLNKGETLVFSYLGYGKKEYVVIESESNAIDITISFDSSDIILMGAVEVEGVYASKRNVFQKFFGLFKK